jgi:hypothetical protein
MAQRDYSRHYQSSHSSGSQYGNTSSQQQYSQSTSTPQYDPASMGQITYQTDPYDPAGQYSGDGPNRGESRSLSHGPSSSTSNSSRRREQNRLAQRALRQRRESHVRELEHQVLHRSLETRHLAVENRELSHHLSTVTQENNLLRYQQVGSSRSAEAWLQGGNTGTVSAGYSPYAQQAHVSPYDESAVFYNHSPHSSTSDPTPMRTPDWNYNDTVDPAMYDHSLAWGSHASAEAGGYEEQYGEDDDEEEEEQAQGWPRRRG